MTAPEPTPAGFFMHVAFDLCSRPCCLPVVRATVGQLAAMDDQTVVALRRLPRSAKLSDGI